MNCELSSRNAMHYSVIIPAAGSGSRMKASLPKVLLPVSESDAGTETVLGQVLTRVAESEHCQHIVVCYPPEYRREFELYQGLFSRVVLIEGGASRQESVRNGVEYLASLAGVADDQIVLIHDAARCSISPDVIGRVVQGVVEYGAVTAAIPVVDSLCRAAHDNVIQGYVDRSALYAIQTPQGFRLSELRRAHERAVVEGVSALDDAALVAALREVRVVAGDPRNIKVTYPVDLELVRERIKGEV